MKIVVCEKKCGSDFQDRVYGRGMRAHTLGVSKARCTVCGHEVQFAGRSAKAKGRTRKVEMPFLGPKPEAKPEKQGRQLGRSR